MNSEGVVEWENTYGGYFFDWAYKAVETADGGFIFAGKTDSSDGDVTGPALGNGDIWVGKVNSTGDLLWNKRLGGSDVDTGYDIVDAGDGGFYVIGDTYSSELPGYSGMSDGLVVKIDENGVIEWQQTYGGSDDDNLREGVVDADGNLILVGGSFSNDGDLPGNYGGLDWWALKIDLVGNVIWSQNYGGTLVDRLHGLDHSANGGFILAGFTYSNNNDVSYNHGSNDMWLVEIDSNGQLIWEKTFGGSNGDLALDVVLTPDGNYLAGGVASSLDGDVTENLGDTDGWLLHVGWNMSVSDISLNNVAKVYPNPFVDQLHIKADSPVKAVKINDMTGKLVSMQSFRSNDVTLNTSGLAKGVYILTVQTATGTHSSKVIKK